MLIKKSYELEIFCNIDIVLFFYICKTSRFIIYKSIDLELWPSLKKYIISASLIDLNCANKISATYIFFSSDLTFIKCWS